LKDILHCLGIYLNGSGISRFNYLFRSRIGGFFLYLLSFRIQSDTVYGTLRIDCIIRKQPWINVLGCEKEAEPA
jgi:hypothetical protein